MHTGNESLVSGTRQGRLQELLVTRLDGLTQEHSNRQSRLGIPLEFSVALLGLFGGGRVSGGRLVLAVALGGSGLGHLFRISNPGLPARMESIVPECTEAKRKYEACFNRWYAEEFLRGGGSVKEDGCVELFQAYRECLIKGLQSRGLDHLLEGDPKPLV